MNILYRYYGIKQQEKTKVSWALLFAFIVGAFQNYILAIPLTLFLTRFSGDWLPQVYLGSAASLLVTGAIISFFEFKTSYNYRMKIILTTISVIMIFFWAGGFFVQTKWIYLILIVWAITAYDLCINPFWSILNRVFTLAQGKRLFGLIGVSLSIGGLLFGLILPLFLKVINLDNMILFIGIQGLIIAFFASKLLNISSKLDNEEDMEVETSIKISALKMSIAWKPCCIAMLGIAALYVVDMLFNTAAEEHYPDQNQLASFLGLYLGVSYFFTLIISSTMYSRLMNRFGVINGTLILPLFVSFVTIILCIADIIPWFAGTVFWLITLLKIFERSLRGSVAEVSYVLFLNPLEPRLKAFVQTKLDLMATPTATVIISLVLIFVSSHWGILPVPFAIMTLIIYALYSLILVSLKTDYMAALHKAIARRYYNPVETINYAPKELNQLLDKYLESSYPQEVIYSLDLIEHQSDDDLIHALDIVKKNNDPIIQFYILRLIKKHKLKNFISFIKDQETHCSDIEYSKEALICLIYFVEIQFVAQKLVVLLNGDDLNRQQEAIVIALNFPSSFPDIQEQARQKLIEMAKSTESTVRLRAANTLKEIKTNYFPQLLDELSQDPNKEVSLSALRAALRVDHQSLFPEIVKNIVSFVSSKEDIELLQKFSAIFAPLLIERYPVDTTKEKRSVLSILAFMEIEPVVRFLEEKSLVGPFKQKMSALEALYEQNMPLNSQYLQKLQKVISSNIQHMELTLSQFKAIPNQTEMMFLRGILHQRSLNYLNKIILFLGLIHNKELLMRAKHGLEFGKDEEISYAIEIILQVATPQQQKSLLPLLNILYFSEDMMVQSTGQFALSDLSNEVIRSNLHYSSSVPLSELGCLPSLYLIKTYNLSGFDKEIAALGQIKSKLIQETLAWYPSK